MGLKFCEKKLVTFYILYSDSCFGILSSLLLSFVYCQFLVKQSNVYYAENSDLYNITLQKKSCSHTIQ